jgi:hypothetical protein
MFEKILIANRGDQLPIGSAATKLIAKLAQLNCTVAESHMAIETRSLNNV